MAMSYCLNFFFLTREIFCRVVGSQNRGTDIHFWYSRDKANFNKASPSIRTLAGRPNLEGPLTLDSVSVCVFAVLHSRAFYPWVCDFPSLCVARVREKQTGTEGGHSGACFLLVSEQSLWWEAGWVSFSHL